MLWKTVTASLLLFWAVMTGLLLRNVYFPERSLFAEVPPRLVLELFLTQTSTSSSTLHLYHHQERIGHANLHVIQLPSKNDNVKTYRLTANGSVETAGSDGEPSANAALRLVADLREADTLSSFEMDLAVPDRDYSAIVRWKYGQNYPAVEVRQGGNLILNTASALALAGFASNLEMLSGLLSPNTSSTKDDTPATPAPTIRAREGLMDLAGKSRRCYVILAESEILPFQALFTEAGELAGIELPQGLRLLDPFIHGLEPGLIEN